MEEIVSWLFWGFLLYMLLSGIAVMAEYFFEDNPEKTNERK